ncbi:hypothetical protein ACLOJK_023211, partial [Asimina triloba]
MVSAIFVYGGSHDDIRSTDRTHSNQRQPPPLSDPATPSEQRRRLHCSDDGSDDLFRRRQTHQQRALYRMIQAAHHVGSSEPTLDPVRPQAIIAGSSITDGSKGIADHFFRRHHPTVHSPPKSAASPPPPPIPIIDSSSDSSIPSISTLDGTVEPAFFASLSTPPSSSTSFVSGNKPISGRCSRPLEIRQPWLTRITNYDPMISIPHRLNRQQASARPTKVIKVRCRYCYSVNAVVAT